MSKKKKIYKPEDVGALIEHFDDKLSIIAEQYRGIKKDTEVIKEDLSTVKEDVSVIKLDIEFIKNELKSKIDRKEFAALERRVSLLESRR